MRDLGPYDIAVLAAIAYHQTTNRDGMKDILGKDISRDLIGRLSERDRVQVAQKWEPILC
ncbi:hypothetical protein [Roseinatronobacter sp. NSM]|uniref:hypothetical protein n=1 Tax=Roseinatronobacter sp. NSM TaxID=3457785 RepID=UPI0040360114